MWTNASYGEAMYQLGRIKLLLNDLWPDINDLNEGQLLDLTVERLEKALKDVATDFDITYEHRD